MENHKIQGCADECPHPRSPRLRRWQSLSGCAVGEMFDGMVGQETANGLWAANGYLRTTVSHAGNRQSIYFGGMGARS